MTRQNQRDGQVVSVSSSDTHTFSKSVQPSIHLVAGEGVVGDAHRGATVKHRSRVAKDPTQPNLRQIHLIHQELISMLVEQGFRVAPGVMGENVTTQGIDLLGLPRHAVLEIGATAKIEVTGLRNPCLQLDNYQDGLMGAVLDKDKAGNLIRKAGIMGIILEGGEVTAGDKIRIVLPPEPHHALERV